MINLEQCDFTMHVQYNGLIAHLVNILFQKPYFEILSDQLASIQMMRVCNFFMIEIVATVLSSVTSFLVQLLFESLKSIVVALLSSSFCENGFSFFVSRTNIAP